MELILSRAWVLGISFILLVCYIGHLQFCTFLTFYKLFQSEGIVFQGIIFLPSLL